MQDFLEFRNSWIIIKMDRYRPAGWSVVTFSETDFQSLGWIEATSSLVYTSLFESISSL